MLDRPNTEQKKRGRGRRGAGTGVDASESLDVRVGTEGGIWCNEGRYTVSLRMGRS